MRARRQLIGSLLDLAWDEPPSEVKIPALSLIQEVESNGRRLVGVKEIAEVLGVSPGWVYRRTRLGGHVIPHYKVGRHVKFDADEVLAFIRDGKAAGKLDEPDVS